MEDRFVEDRAPDDRLAENRSPDDPLAENRSPDDRLAENRSPDDPLAENRSPDDRLGEDGSPDDRLGEDRLAEDGPVDDRLAKNRSVAGESVAGESVAGESVAGDSVAGGSAEAPDRPAGEQRPGEAAAAAAVPAAVPAVTPSAVTSHGPGPARLDPDPTGAGSLGARDEAAKLDPGMNSETGAPGDEPLIGDQPHLREDWQDIQAAFVDDPGGSVRRAADLAETVVRMLLDSAEARTRELRGEWDGGQADTEALRLALRRYRVFIDRLCVV